MATATQGPAPSLVRGVRTTRSTIFLKLLMAASGLVFVGFVLLHMYGNLRAFWGESAYNEYSEGLRDFLTPDLPRTGFLWILRVVLLVSLAAHVASAVALWRRAHRARPVKYQVKKNKGSAFTSRFMRWGGLTLLLFIVWHLLEFTIVKVNVGSGPASDDHNPYRLLVDTFNVPWMTAIYLLAMLTLAFHLHHGVWSSLQTLGLTNSARSRANAKRAGLAAAVVIAGGFSLVPFFIAVGVIAK